MDNLNLALDGVCWRYPNGIVALQTSVFLIFGGLAIDKAQKRMKKTRQTEREESRWRSTIDSERLSVVELLKFTAEYLLARVDERFDHNLDIVSQITNNCYARGIFNRGFVVCFLI
jgi:hypothetical protein